MLFPVTLLLELAVDSHARELPHLLRVATSVLGVSVLTVFEIVLADPRTEKGCRQHINVPLSHSRALR